MDMPGKIGCLGIPMSEACPGDTVWFEEMITKETLKGARYTISHVTTTPESHVSFRFALWSAVFELQAILRKCTK